MKDIFESLKEVLEDRNANKVIRNAPMAEHTSYKTGGKADFLLLPESEKDLKKLLGFLKENSCRYMLMGNGSNILVRDGGFPGIIIKIGKSFETVMVKDCFIEVGAGTLLAAVSRKAAEESLTGLEFASGIPGSVGGAIFMNAGAYGGEMKDVVKSVRILDREGATKILVAEELDFGYRHSRIQNTGEIVLSVVYNLKKGDKESIKHEMKELAQKRNSKQPVTYPSCGSFFKRPEGHFAGKLIEDAGFKGLKVGGAQVSELHCGFIINTGEATSKDIIELMHIVQAGVNKKFGVLLEPEVRIVGKD